MMAQGRIASRASEARHLPSFWWRQTSASPFLGTSTILGIEVSESRYCPMTNGSYRSVKLTVDGVTGSGTDHSATDAWATSFGTKTWGAQQTHGAGLDASHRQQPQFRRCVAGDSEREQTTRGMGLDQDQGLLQ